MRIIKVKVESRIKFWHVKVYDDDESRQKFVVVNSGKFSQIKTREDDKHYHYHCYFFNNITL